MQKIQQLRKIGLVFDVSGMAIPIANTKLFQGGFGFVVLQAYVPITQNRSETSYPLCTTYQITIDNAGQRRQFNDLKHNMLYVGDVTLEQGDYMLYECPLPKSYTDTVGELDIMIEYCEIIDDEIVSRITSNMFSTTVYEGAISTGVSIDPTGGELARLNAITIQMDLLEESVNALLEPPDVTEANNVGVVDVEITPLGNLKFVNLKGDTGATGVGIQGPKGDPSTLDLIGTPAIVGNFITVDLDDVYVGIYGTNDNPIVINELSTITFTHANSEANYQKSVILYIKRTANVSVVWNNITEFYYDEIPILPLGTIRKVHIESPSATTFYGEQGGYINV